MDDTISRQAAIDALTDYWDGIKSRHQTLDGELAVYADCKGIIKRLPPAQQEQRWVSATERLPEDLEEVNVTWVNHDPEPYYDFVKDKPCSGSAVHYKGSWYWYSSTCVDILAEYGRNERDKIDDGIEVVAWRELPEPWKGEDDGQKM